MKGLDIFGNDLASAVAFMHYNKGAAGGNVNVLGRWVNKSFSLALLYINANGTCSLLTCRKSTDKGTCSLSGDTITIRWDTGKITNGTIDDDRIRLGDEVYVRR